ncbi:hypothetical protein PVAP13_9KG509052, partial [Panicum virgatum]
DAPLASPPPPAPALEEGEIPPLAVDDVPPAADAAVEDAPLAEEDLQRPDAIDVFMPPVRMQRFAHLAFGLVDPTPEPPASHIRHALSGPGGNPRVTLAPSSYGAALIMFESNAAREQTMLLAPFLGREHTVRLERHTETPNRFQFGHEAFAHLAIRNFPMEHWNHERIVYSAGPYANPHLVDPVCIQGTDFSAVLLTVKVEGTADIPFEEYVKNHAGLGAGPAAPPHPPPPPVAADAAVPGEAPPPAGLPLDGSVAAALGIAFMSLGDVLPIPIGRDLGQLYYPEVLAEPLLSKPVSVSFHMLRGSFFEIRTVGERGERGRYRIPTQPFRTNIPGD